MSKTEPAIANDYMYVYNIQYRSSVRQEIMSGDLIHDVDNKDNDDPTNKRQTHSGTQQEINFEYDLKRERVCVAVAFKNGFDVILYLN